MKLNPLTVDIQTGLITPARYVPSPYCDDRPQGILIDMVVIHGISLPPGDFTSLAVEALFTGTLAVDLHPYFVSLKDVQVSAHLFIRRDGELIQFVPFGKRAWHAGVSSFQGKTRCNDFSIGIELEGTDTLPYENQQYQQLIEVIRALKYAYPELVQNRIVGHSDVAPGRKTDPGASFDWNKIKEIE